MLRPLPLRMSTRGPSFALRWLSRTLPGGRRLAWLSAALVLGPFLLLGLVLLLAAVFRFEVRVDLALIGFSVAAVLVAAALYLLVRHRVRPKQTVSVGFHYELAQPALPMGRYAFRMEVYYDLEEKGERSRVDQGTIELRFRRRDHPEMLGWCCRQVSLHLEKHGEFAVERYPGARVHVPPSPTPELLAEAVDRIEQEGRPRPGSGIGVGRIPARIVRRVLPCTSPARLPMGTESLPSAGSSPARSS